MRSPAFAVAVPNIFEISGPFQTFCWFAFISFPNLFSSLTWLLCPDVPALKIWIDQRSNSPFSLVLYSRITHIVLQYLRKTRNATWCFSLLCDLLQSKMLTKSQLFKAFQGLLKSFAFEMLLTSVTLFTQVGHQIARPCKDFFFFTGIKIVDTNWICC